MQPGQYLPTILPLLLATGHDNHVSDDRHSLDYDRKAHQEANRPPHGAEITVIVAVSGLGEIGAGVSQGRAATVEAVGIVDVATGGLQKIRC